MARFASGRFTLLFLGLLVILFDRELFPRQNEMTLCIGRQRRNTQPSSAVRDINQNRDGGEYQCKHENHSVHRSLLFCCASNLRPSPVGKIALLYVFPFFGVRRFSAAFVFWFFFLAAKTKNKSGEKAPHSKKRKNKKQKAVRNAKLSNWKRHFQGYFRVTHFGSRLVLLKSIQLQPAICQRAACGHPRRFAPMPGAESSNKSYRSPTSARLAWRCPDNGDDCCANLRPK
jgi:hypothetical protein